MSKALQSFSLEHLTVGCFEYVQLLLILVIHHLIRVDDLTLLLAVVWLEGRDIVDHTNCTWAINPCRDSLLPDAQVIFLKLV